MSGHFVVGVPLSTVYIPFVMREHRRENSFGWLKLMGPMPWRQSLQGLSMHIVLARVNKKISW